VLGSVAYPSLCAVVDSRNAISKVSNLFTSLYQKIDPHVDTTHLLRNHDDTRSLRGTADARYSEELDEAREEIVSLRETGLFNHALFLIQLRLDVVDVSCRLQRRVAKP
jgi:hypothetical protein